jgi:hypothetical protein
MGRIKKDTVLARKSNTPRLPGSQAPRPQGPKAENLSHRLGRKRAMVPAHDTRHGVYPHLSVPIIFLRVVRKKVFAIDR